MHMYGLGYSLRSVYSAGYTSRITAAPLLPKEMQSISAPRAAMKREQFIIMNENIIRQIENEQLKKDLPEFSVGDTIRVYARIKEGTRERIQMFEGTVMKRQNGGIYETFTVRRMSYGVGVEKTWPLHSPVIDHMEVVRKGSVRRAKLTYLRDRVGKAAKVKEKR